MKSKLSFFYILIILLSLTSSESVFASECLPLQGIFRCTIQLGSAQERGWNSNLSQIQYFIRIQPLFPTLFPEMTSEDKPTFMIQHQFIPPQDESSASADILTDNWNKGFAFTANGVPARYLNDKTTYTATCSEKDYIQQMFKNGEMFVLGHHIPFIFQAMYYNDASYNEITIKGFFIPERDLIETLDICERVEIE